MVFTCPGCDKPEHLYVHRSKALYICFRCGLRGGLLKDLVGRKSEWRRLCRLSEAREGPSEAEVDLGGCLYPLTGEAPPRGTPVAGATRYCLRRGLNQSQISRYMVSAKPFDGRVWFPYWSRGRLTWAIGRSMGAVEPKTLDMGSDKPLFGLHVYRPVGDVFLVEGVFDHFATPGSLALCGSTISHTQLAELVSLELSRVFVLLDPDAEEKALQVAESCRSAGLKAYPVLLRGNDKDPADLGRVLVTELVKVVREGAPVRPQAVRLHV